MKNIFIILFSFILTNVGFSDDFKLQEKLEIILEITKDNKTKFTYIDYDIFDIKKGCEYKTVCELLLDELAILRYPGGGSCPSHVVIEGRNICFIHNNMLVLMTGAQFTFSVTTELLEKISYKEIELFDSTKTNLEEIKNKHQKLVKKRALEEPSPNPWYGFTRYEYFKYQHILHSFIPHKRTEDGIIWTIREYFDLPPMKTDNK